MMRLAGLRGGARRVRPDADGGDGARRDRRSAGSAVPADAAAREAFPVVVIGCGQSGLLAGIRLKEAGIPFTIVEKNAGVGRHLVGELVPRGPGRRRQPLLLLQLRAERRVDRVLRPAARAAGLLRGGDGQARHRATRPLGDRGARRGWDDGDGTWSVRVRADDGTESTLSARAVISAVGQLNRPHIPDIPGQERFAGPAFHSARWDHSVDLTGKRVAMIGAGASGFQIAPAIAADVEAPDRLPADGAVDVPEPELPRRGGTGRAGGRCGTCPSTGAGTGS